jgi:hypothetical protein
MNGDVMWDVTNFKTRDTYGFDEMFIAAKHRPIVQFYVDRIRPEFARKYNPTRYSQSVQSDQHERGLFLRSNGLRYEDFGDAFAALTKQHVGKRITLTRWRMIAATAADERLDISDRKVMDAADAHSSLTANHYYVKRTKQETVRRSVQLFQRLKEQSLADSSAPSILPAAGAAAALSSSSASASASSASSAVSDSAAVLPDSDADDPESDSGDSSTDSSTESDSDDSQIARPDGTLTSSDLLLTADHVRCSRSEQVHQLQPLRCHCRLWSQRASGVASPQMTRPQMAHGPLAVTTRSVLQLLLLVLLRVLLRHRCPYQNQTTKAVAVPDR